MPEVRIEDRIDEAKLLELTPIILQIHHDSPKMEEGEHLNSYSYPFGYKRCGKNYREDKVIENNHK